MKIRKIMKTSILILLLIIFLTNIVFAEDITNQINLNPNKVNEFDEVGKKIFDIIRLVAIISSVIALMVIGIKYMLGSLEERAEYKKTFIKYLTGCILAFGIVGLIEMLGNWISSL